jgi:signal transduction histidine kinase
VKKIALVFVSAVLVPSLVLAWLAVRSLRNQQLVLERQQYLLYQGVADGLASQADAFTAGCQRDFGQEVEALLSGYAASNLAVNFDQILRSNWPYAAVGFAVDSGGELMSPSPTAGFACATFVADNGKFLNNREPAEVYWNSLPGQDNQGLQAAVNNAFRNPVSSVTKESVGITPANQKNAPQAAVNNSGDNSTPQNSVTANSSAQAGYPLKSSSEMNAGQSQNNYRNVVPQQNLNSEPQQYSKIAPAETEFRQLIGSADEGTISRFVDNRLNVLMWHRPAHQPNLIFGAQLSLKQIKDKLNAIVQGADPALRDDIAVALLDDSTRPVAISRPGFSTNWKHPFVASELDESLPHWEMAVYLLNPDKLAQSAHTAELTLGLLIAVLVLAIAVGGWLIVTDLNRQLTLARQKTDFVSNVSHELKTPLTSIRMFSELLAEDRVSEPDKRRSYLQIIAAEASRLTRLINNVLDFSRIERGEKKYQFQPFDLTALVRETVGTYRPHLESLGFKITTEFPDTEIAVNGDRDALSQVLVNLLSNAEKYSGDVRDISVELKLSSDVEPAAEVRVLDRGTGVPKGCEEKIFEQFYRAHDSLSSGIQGSGLGLTLARRIARAHGGEISYVPRESGGSCFILRLPLSTPKPATHEN